MGARATTSATTPICFRSLKSNFSFRCALILMAAVPDEAQRRSDSWGVQDNQSMMPGSNSEPVNNASLSADDRVGQEHENTEYSRGGTVEVSVSSNKADPYRGEKQVKVLRSLLVCLCLLHNYCFMQRWTENLAPTGLLMLRQLFL